MIAVVTGGCSGLGLCFTKYLLSLGYKVYALYNKSLDGALKLESEYDNVRCIKCDLRQESAICNTLFKIGNFDLLINNASISLDNNYQDKTKKEFMSVLEVNVVGTFLMIKEAINYLNENGVIVNISSNNALDNYNPISMDYDVSKSGINMLTKDFSLVLNNKKIFSICPGWINTDAVMNMNQDYLINEMNKVKQEKLLDKEKLAKYIIDNINNYKNGEIIEIKEV